MANSFLSAQRVISDVRHPVHDSAAASSLKLLIVEDVQEDVELIAIALQAAGLEFEWEVADSLEQCHRLLAEQLFSVVLADYRLPGLQAPQVFQLVSELQPSTPFILVTGSLGEEAAVECIKTGMTDYVLKDRLYRLPTVLQRALSEAELKRQQAAAIAQIEQQAWRESVLNRIVQVVRETLVLEDVLQNTVDQLQIALGVDRCLVVQPTADQQMVVQYISTADGEPSDLLHMPCEICLHFEEELRAGQQIVVHQADSCRSETVAEFLAMYNLQSALITPLNYLHEFFGALTLHHVHQHRHWTVPEVSLVKAVADQCAIAIYQSNLYTKAQRELEQRRRVEEQLRHDAFHDGLTGLPNRALFLDRLNHALQIAHRHQDGENNAMPRNFAVLFLDLDDFRIVNDSLGHDAGDFLLQVVAARLNRCLRVGDTLARTSGDEFAVLLEDISGIDDIIEVVESIQSVLRHPITLESQEIFVSSCIGIVMDGPNYSDAAQFLRDADTAMYQAKGKGRGSYQVFNWTMHTEVKQRLQLENDLRRALDRNEFSLAYQPIIHLPSQRFCGFEALIRWSDPIQGMLSPNQFIPIAEQTGLIIPIGQWVIRQACWQWQRWLQRWPVQLQDCNISINLSAKQFAQSNLIGQIEAILRETGMDSHRLRVEITESALLENETTSLETLRQLKARRIQVAMDDFGTGYSSLSYLLRFPKDVLKIDKSFVSNLDNNPDNQAIIKTILALGRNLGLDVVAEGIETAHQAEFLLQQGCVFGQGFWFSAPLTSSHAEAMLADQFGTVNPE
jgi:diguanylate cyclase (GGDEF)-like protein